MQATVQPPQSLRPSSLKHFLIVHNIWPQAMSTYEERWRRRFERFAVDYEDDHLISGWSKTGLTQRFSQFRRLIGDLGLPPHARILDLGCGTGVYIRFLAELGYKTFGLDYSLPSLTRAKNQELTGNNKYLCGEAYHLPFESLSFDLVVSIGVMQALSDPKRAIDEMARVLCPHGYLVIEFINLYALHSLSKHIYERVRGHENRVQRYSANSVIRMLARCGVEKLMLESIFLPPRNLPSPLASSVLNAAFHVLGSIPAVRLLAAHACYLIGQKT
jgi:SAM-dependent methyltransferase